VTKLVKYDAACRALGEARRVDEVKRIRDQAIAMKLYAKLAEDGRLMNDAEAIQRRAEHRLARLMEAQAATVGKAKGGAEKGVGRRGNAGSDKTRNVPTLAEAGISKSLANRARLVGAIDDKTFDKVIDEARRKGIAPTLALLKPMADAAADRIIAARPKANGSKRAPMPKPSPLYDPWSKLSRAVRDVADQDRAQFQALAQQARRVGFLEMDTEHARKAVVRLAQWLSALQREKKHGQA
jgi:hypothetical protein